MIQSPKSSSGAHFLIQPGWQNSGPHHWQTLWEMQLGAQADRVPQRDWMVPDRVPWVNTLEQSIRSSPSPVVILAHSIGCIAAVYAMRTVSVAGAILVAPADAEREGAPPSLRTFAPIPMERLSGPALLITSDNDPYCTPERAKEFAQAWMSDIEVVPGGGHLNSEAGFGPWPEGWQMVGEWLKHHGLAWPEVDRTHE